MDNSHKHRRPTEFIQMINYDEDTSTLLQREKQKYTVLQQHFKPTGVCCQCSVSGDTNTGLVSSQSTDKKTSRHRHLAQTSIYLKQTHPFNGPFPGLPRWAGTRKVKPIWILLKQETESSSGISWAMCKSAPRSRQITTPEPHHSVFTGRMPFLPPNQQRQSTETIVTWNNCIYNVTASVL